MSGLVPISIQPARFSLWPRARRVKMRYHIGTHKPKRRIEAASKPFSPSPSGPGIYDAVVGVRMFGWETVYGTRRSDLEQAHREMHEASNRYQALSR